MNVIDLNKTLEEGMDVYPGDPEVRIRQAHTLEKEGWVRTITNADGTVKNEPHVSTYSKPVWHSLVKKYQGADGMKLLMTQ